LTETTTAPDADPDLDQALLAKDAARTAYIYRRLAIRRRMAVCSFLVFIVGNCALIVAALASDAIAARAVQLSMIIATFDASLAGVIGFYWGCGAYEHGNMFGGGMGGGMYGGGFGSSYGSSSFTPNFTPTRTVPPVSAQAETTGMHKGE
jgi:hypothetical protein